MWTNFATVILLFLHTAQTQENMKTLQKLEQIVALPGDNVTMSCPILDDSWREAVTWYKEQRDRSLHKILWSYGSTVAEGRYSGRMSNLTISSVQRNDSGAYYCATGFTWKFSFFGGARLIVTDTPGPRHSILVPFPFEGTQPNLSVSFLCLTFDANPAWDNFSWAISREHTQDQKGVGVIDEGGGFSIWHFETMPLEGWTDEEAYPCLLQDNRKATEAGNCFAYVYFGVPAIIGLLVLSSILIFVKHRAGGNSEQRANQIPKRGIPQTTYAEMPFKNRNVRSVV